MFNIGGGELIVIMLIALVVLGPQRLPDAARQIGKTMGDLRRLSTGFQDEMRSALDTVDDPGRVTPRREVLASPPADDAPASDAIAQVTAQPSTPAKRAPRTAPLKAAPAEPTAAKSPAKKPAAKKPAAARKKAAPKAAPRRPKG
jgi:Tat protein translocase TatB subunit